MSVNVAGIDTNLGLEPWRTWCFKKSGMIGPGRYPSVSRVSINYQYMVAGLAANPKWKFLEHVLLGHSYIGTASTQHLMGSEVIIANSAENKWYSVNDVNNDALYTKKGNNDFYRQVNPNYEGTDPGDTHSDYITALWAKRQQRGGTGAAQDFYGTMAGTFYDSTDFQDAFPRDYTDPLVWTVNGNVDYAKPKGSGDTNPARWREGNIYAVQQERLQWPDGASSSNGGRDNGAVNKILTDNEWAGFWDLRLYENVASKMGLEKDAGLQTFSTRFADMGARVPLMYRGALICSTMVNRTATNKLGDGLAVIDWPTEYSGTINTGSGVPGITDIPQDFYEVGRFCLGLALLDDKFIAAPNLQRGTLPYPLMDECVYNFGDPIGSDPSIGSIDTTTTAYDFIMRADDDNGWYWVIGDGGAGPAVCVMVNLNPPTGNAAWPQSVVSGDAVAPPAPPNGGVWRYIDGNYSSPIKEYNGSASVGEDQSPLVNTGGLVGSTINSPRWTMRLIVEDTS